MRKIVKLTALALMLLVLALPMSCAYAATAEEQPEIKRHNDKWGFPHKEGIVLVLSGGGTKGLSHIGVLEVLEREKIPIAAIVGTSMGAVMGGLYAAGYTSKEMKDLLSKVNLMEIISDRSTASFVDTGYNRPSKGGAQMLSFQVDKKSHPRGKLGILRTKDLYTFLSELTSRVTVTDFDDLSIPFAAIATNLETGETVVLRDGNLASALRASLSIPGVFDPWEMDGKLLVDGGLKANLPVFEAQKIFPGHPIVAVNLSPENITRPREKLRSILEVAAQTLEILMVKQVRENAAAADIVISPEVEDFSILGSTGYDKIIQRGIDATLPHVKELHQLMDQHHLAYSEDTHTSVTKKESPPKVVEIRFEGVPDTIAKALHDKYRSWIGQPLDMENIAEAVKLLSSREEFQSVEGRTQTYTKDTVAVIFYIERPAKYEFGMNGYVGSINPDRWLSLSAQARDIFLDGDVATLESRFGTRWGAMLRYFSPLDERDSQFSLILSARREKMEPDNAAAFDFERYIGRVAWYRNLNNKIRIGAGYMVERANFLDDKTISGPFFSFSIDALDDPIIPTRGIALASDIWLPLGETAITHTRFQTHLPVLKEWKITLSGGLKTGDADNLAYAAMLGSGEELYSLAHNPLVGDQAYWLHFGAVRMLMKSWWGGVNIELFGNYGQVMRKWKNTGSWWETGIALSIPTNNFVGKFTVVYDQGGEVTFGYSIGIPLWWNGPLP